MMNYPQIFKCSARRLIPSFLALIAAFICLVSCNPNDSNSDLDPVLRDEYSFYIIDPGPFEVIDPASPDFKEFLILKSGGVEISCGIFPGVHISEGAVEEEVSSFAMESVQNTNWLPGVQRWMLDSSAVTIDGRWFYYVTLLVRRDPEWTSQLTELQLIVHRNEIERFPETTDMIVRVYYTIREKDLYILTLSGSPEDIAASERIVRRLLANIRLDAAALVAETE